MKQFLYYIILLCGINLNSNSQILGVPTIGQETDHWCTEASTSALLKYFAIHVSQCELKDFLRTHQNWPIIKDNCCAGSNQCDQMSGYISGLEGSSEDALNVYGAIRCVQRKTPLSLDQIRYLIGKGRPFLVGLDHIHAVVCYGISGNTLMIMDPWDGGYTENYTYSRYTDECTNNLYITCINEIEINGELNEPGKSYIYEAAQSISILPGTEISSNVEFQANITGSTNCDDLCIAPTCQIVFDNSDGKIKLHVRNGASYNFKLYRYDGALVKEGSGYLNSNDEEVDLCSAANSIYVMKEITITSDCGTSRTIRSYKLPII